MELSKCSHCGSADIKGRYFTGKYSCGRSYGCNSCGIRGEAAWFKGDMDKWEQQAINNWNEMNGEN